MQPSVLSLILESNRLLFAGKTGEALQAARQALQAAEEINDSQVQGSALANLGYLYFNLGQLSRSQAAAEAALTIALEGSQIQADALAVLGMCAGKKHQIEQAEHYLLDAAELSRERGYRLTRARVLHHLATLVYAPRGQFQIAISINLESLHLARQYGLAEWVWIGLVTSAWFAWASGDLTLADELVEQLRAVTTPESIGGAWGNFLSASLQMERGDVKAAHQQLISNFELVESLGIPTLRAWLRLALSRANRMRGAMPEALAWAEDALRIIARVPYQHVVGVAHIEIARAHWALEERAAAQNHLSQAIAILTSNKTSYELALAWLLLAELYRQQEDPRAEESWDQAAHLILNGAFLYLLDQEREAVYGLLARYLNHPKEALAGASQRVLDAMQGFPILPLYITTLGGLRIQVGPRQVRSSALRQRRAGELFCLLLLAPGFTLSLEEAAELLSPNKPADASRTVLHKATSSLRHALEPDLPDRRFPSRYLNVQDNHIRLYLPSGSKIDFQQFLDAFEQSRWEKARQLYSGDLLPDYPYNERIMRQREFLIGRYGHTLLILADQAYLQESWHEALLLSMVWVERDPTHEQAAYIAMRSANQMGNRSLAARIFLRLQKELMDELGILPKEEICSFYLDLSQHG